MQSKFEKIMSSLPDQKLERDFNDRRKFVPEAVEAMITELQKRGRTFTEEELLQIREEVHVIDAKREESSFQPSGIWARNITDDISAPVFYSERAIYLFSIFMTPLFGAILSAINFNKNGSRKGVWEVIGFGTGFTVFTTWIYMHSPRNSLMTVFFNSAGALILFLFWNKYIGKNTKYRAHSIWIPLLIGIGITALLLFALDESR